MCEVRDMPADSAPLSAPSPGALLSSNRFAIVCVVNFGAMISFYLLFPVAPLIVTQLGGGSAQAGLATGAIMLATIFAELSTTMLQRRLSSRVLLAIGLGLLGVPAAALGFVESPSMVLALSAIRGLGLGLLLVVSATVVAETLTPERRSAGFSFFGVIVGLPAILVMPAGPWLMSAAGVPTTGLIAAIAALIGLLALLALPGRKSESEETGSIARLLRDRETLRSAVTLLWIATATGICTSLLPLVHPWASSATVAFGLLAHSICAVAARGASGAINGAARQSLALRLGVVVTAAGLLALAIAANDIVLISAMAALGAGFGLVQTPTFLTMLARSNEGDQGSVSALWNLAYDAGLGLGGVMFGMVAGGLGPFNTLIVIALVTCLLLAMGRTARGPAHLRPPSRRRNRRDDLVRRSAISASTAHFARNDDRMASVGTFDILPPR